LQNCDRQLGAKPGALTLFETADGAGKTHFKRLSRNFSRRAHAAEMLRYNHYCVAIRLRLSAPAKWPMLQ
jgi:hypothetical protein